VFDPTNLYTFIASENERNTMAQRGHNKHRRHDLRQVGLTLLTTRTHQLPLLHYTYAGDRPDARTTRELAERLRLCFDAVLKRASRVTLIYDRGAHSDELLTLFESGEFHFVCGLQANRYRQRLEASRSELEAVADLPGFHVKRSAVTIAGRRYTHHPLKRRSTTPRTGHPGTPFPESRAMRGGEPWACVVSWTVVVSRPKTARRNRQRAAPPKRGRWLPWAYPTRGC
jgi:hypothetical protein